MLHVLMWIGIVIGGLIVAWVLFMLIGSLVSLLTGVEPKGITVSVEAPEQVANGTAFDVKIRVSDTSGNKRKLCSIDFDLSLLKGFSIDAIDPPPQDSSSAWGTRIHEYERSLEATSTFEVDFRCLATTPGAYSGNVYAYVDSHSFRYVERPLLLTVNSIPSNC